MMRWRSRHDVFVEQILLHGRIHRDERVPPGREQHSRSLARHLDNGKSRPRRLRCVAGGNGACPACCAQNHASIHPARAAIQWPYTYDTCDIGTVPNQTVDGQPQAATVGGDQGHDGILSFLPGQRLSRCTCDGESHPGPKHSDGTFVGRAAPEIDVFEAQITEGTLIAQVSQSAQWAVSGWLPTRGPRR